MCEHRQGSGYWCQTRRRTKAARTTPTKAAEAGSGVGAINSPAATVLVAPLGPEQLSSEQSASIPKTGSIPPEPVNGFAGSRAKALVPASFEELVCVSKRIPVASGGSPVQGAAQKEEYVAPARLLPAVVTI